jgi:lipopolysaccharide/colanic/teichoic acid biosynthesis glycosyltransferase
MRTGWRYRVGSVLGVVLLSGLAVLLANQAILQSLFTTYVPIFWRLEPTMLSGRALYAAMGLTVAVTTGCLIPLYKPRPRRILDIVALAHKRVLVAGSVLATLGFFNYSYRLPRATLLMAVTFLFVAVPAWFLIIRRSPNGTAERAVIVGDDPDTIAAVRDATDLPVIGYIAPPSGTLDTPIRAPITPDGGTVRGSTNLGGLSRLGEVFIEYDVDVALLAFAAPDRAEFFGALDTCYEHGVTAKVHRQHADSVLTSGFGSETLLDVELEPWDTFDHITKRLFDVLFAGIGLFVAVPIVAAIAVAIKLDDGGSILYGQERTATFGDTFRVYKFRSMVENAEDATPVDDERNPDITRVGRFIRRTHLDEIPQLYSILKGDMSVVGPRAVWTEEEFELEEVTDDWRKRWFVKPGLTGLAQINDVSSTEPKAKLRYDVEYIRRQSLWFDLKIVTRQVWQVLEDLTMTVLRR